MHTVFTGQAVKRSSSVHGMSVHMLITHLKCLSVDIIWLKFFEFNSECVLCTLYCICNFLPISAVSGRRDRKIQNWWNMFERHVSIKRNNSYQNLSWLMTCVSGILDKLIRSTFLCCFTGSHCNIQACVTLLPWHTWIVFIKLFFLCLVLSTFLIQGSFWLLSDTFF